MNHIFNAMETSNPIPQEYCKQKNVDGRFLKILAITNDGVTDEVTNVPTAFKHTYQWQPDCICIPQAHSKIILVLASLEVRSN
jgi:hypothetical protein